MSDEETIKYIKKHFIYNNDGSLNRTDRKNSNGSYDKDGYLIIKIKEKQYKAHRVVFAIFNNRFPENEIDHINRLRTDNRIENLREVDRRGNNQNKDKKVNKNTGVCGIYIDKTIGLKKKYAFSHNKKTYRYYSIEEAIKKREEIQNEYL